MQNKTGHKTARDNHVQLSDEDISQIQSCIDVDSSHEIPIAPAAPVAPVDPIAPATPIAPHDDMFIALVKSSQFSNVFKEAVIGVIARATRTPTTPASVLLGMTGFYVFSHDAKSFVTVRQKVLTFTGTALVYGNVKLAEKFPYTVEMFAACGNASRALYVEMVPQHASSVVTPIGKKISSVCPYFSKAALSHPSVVRDATKRSVFQFLNSESVFEALDSGNQDKDGFGVTRMMVCQFVAMHVLEQSRSIELQLGFGCSGRYINFPKNAEATDAECVGLLVFVNPTLAPNSKPDGVLTLFTSGYSGIYGKSSPVFLSVPQSEFACFSKSLNKLPQRRNELDLADGTFSF